MIRRHRRRRRGVDRLDDLRPLTAHFQETLLLLHPLADALLPLLLDLSLESLRLTPAFIKDHRSLLFQVLDLAVDRGLLLREPVILQSLALAIVEDGEQNYGRHAGRAGLGVFTDHGPVDPGHVGNDHARRLADLDILDHRAIDADAGPADILEGVGVITHVDHLPPLDPAPAGALDLLATDSAVDDDAVLVERAFQFGRLIEHGADLPDRQSVASKIGIGEVAFVDENPGL